MMKLEIVWHMCRGALLGQIAVLILIGKLTALQVVIASLFLPEKLYEPVKTKLE
jgi:hypothetical protein